jgi:prepilin peptidase CpaA
LALALLIACWTDFRSRTIPNWLCAAVALGALPYWWIAGLPLWPDIALQIGVAAFVFGLFAMAFAAGAMGGGDVKLIGALCLWLPWQSVLMLLVIMSLAGGLLTLVMLAHSRLRRHRDRLEIPYGVAIAVGGLWLLGQRFLYQFG